MRPLGEGTTPMQRLLQLARAIDACNARIGRLVSWAIVASIFVSATNAIIRKAFDISSNAWLEAQWYLFGLTFMLASAWTLQRREHIRIDIFFNRLPRVVRHWIELGGHLLFLIPFVTLMIVLSWSAFGRAVLNNGVAWNAADGFLGQLTQVLRTPVDRYRRGALGWPGAMGVLGKHRRAAAVAGLPVHPRRLRDAAAAGDFRDDQAYRGDARPVAGTLWRWSRPAGK